MPVATVLIRIDEGKTRKGVARLWLERKKECSGSTAVLAFKICGCCREQYETNHRRQKGTEGFTHQYAKCKGAHTA
jgi:hypothetical protein